MINELSNFGGIFNALRGSKLKAVTLSSDKETVTFEFEEGPSVAYGVEGDCCSISWIEHLELPTESVLGLEILGVEDVCMGEEEKGDYDCLRSYETRFRTAKGDIVLEYRNSSNGYYGGYLVSKEAA
jgi:hypothetical protein